MPKNESKLTILAGGARETRGYEGSRLEADSSCRSVSGDTPRSARRTDAAAVPARSRAISLLAQEAPVRLVQSHRSAQGHELGEEVPRDSGVFVDELHAKVLERHAGFSRHSQEAIAPEALLFDEAGAAVDRPEETGFDFCERHDHDVRPSAALNDGLALWLRESGTVGDTRHVRA